MQTQVPRSFYDYLSLLLVLSFVLYLSLSRFLLPYEEKIEQAVARIGKKWIPLLLDGLVVIMAAIFIYKAVKIIYTYPISCRTADMLPMIRGAGEYLLSLKNPFNQCFCPWRIEFFVYLPMMIVYYLPGLILKIDIRFLSLFFYLGILLSGYSYYRRRGYYLTGFLIFVVFITSGLFPLFLITLHTFPYLLLLSILCLALLGDKEKLLFFALALAIATRKFFWLYLPLFLIYFLKNRKITLPHFKFFGLGTFIGFSLYIFFPSHMVKSSFFHLLLQHQNFRKDLHLKHSLGLTYHLFDHQIVSMVVLMVFYVVICIFAVRTLNKKNFWMFLFLVTTVFCYVQSHTRPEEYYYLPLIIFLLFAPVKDFKGRFGRKNMIFLGLPIALCLCVFLLFFPYLLGKELIINPVRGHTGGYSPEGIHSNGFLEVSVAKNFTSKKSMTFLIRRIHYRENEPVRITIRINEKDYIDELFQTRRISIPFDRITQKKYFYIGANSIEVALDEPKAFYLKIREGAPIVKHGNEGLP